LGRKREEKKVISFPVPSSNAPAIIGLQVPDPQSPALTNPALPEQLVEARAALHADTMSALEISITAALWNYHPRPLRISEVYLAARSSPDDSLEPCASALNHLCARGLVRASGAPDFRYQLSRDGIFAALYLAIAGASDKFNLVSMHGEMINAEAVSGEVETIANAVATPAARVLPDHLARLPIVKPASEVDIEYCHTGCGRIATGLCECGNVVCTAHRYNADGQHDPAGACSACYDEIVAER